MDLLLKRHSFVRFFYYSLHVSRHSRLRFLYPKGGEHHIYPSRRQKIKPRLEAHALKLDSPSFWKVPQTLNGGALSQSHESDYAEYFLKTAQAFDAIGLRLVLKFKSYVFVLGQASANHFSRFAWIFSLFRPFAFTIRKSIKEQKSVLSKETESWLESFSGSRKRTDFPVLVSVSDIPRDLKATSDSSLSALTLVSIFSDYPTMLMGPSQQASLGAKIRSKLDSNSFLDIRLIANDNK